MVTRFEGLVVGITFLMWLVIDPALVVHYTHEPIRAGGILLSLVGSIYFALKLRHCEISYSTLRGMLPALVLAGLGIVFGKLAMVHSDYHSGVWYYALFQSVLVLSVYVTIMTVPALAKLFPNEAVRQNFFDKRLLIAAAFLSVGWLIHTPAKYFAISDVKNPAYVTVIGLTSPLWILLIYRLIGRREKVDIFSGLGIVFCAVLLVIFTQL